MRCVLKFRIYFRIAAPKHIGYLIIINAYELSFYDLKKEYALAEIKIAFCHVARRTDYLIQSNVALYINGRFVTCKCIYGDGGQEI